MIRTFSSRSVYTTACKRSPMKPNAKTRASPPRITSARREVSQSKCPSRSVPVEVSQSKCPSRSVPVEVSQSKCPSRSVPVEVSQSKCPSRSVPVEVSQSKCPSRSVLSPGNLSQAWRYWLRAWLRPTHNPSPPSARPRPPVRASRTAPTSPSTRCATSARRSGPCGP